MTSPQPGECPIRRFPQDFPSPPDRPLDLADLYTEIQRQGGAARVVLPDANGQPGEEAVLAVGHRAVRTVLNDPAFKRWDANAIEPFPDLTQTDQHGNRDKDLALLTVLDDEDHRAVRELAQTEFTREAVERHRPAVERIVAAAIDDMLAAGPDKADLMEDVGLRVSLNVIGDVLGIPEADRPAFRQWSDELLVSAADAERGQEAQAAMGGYMLGMIEDRRANPRDDLMTHMTERAAATGVSDFAVAGLAFAITVGGWETEAAQIANGTIRLLTNHHPDGSTWWSTLHRRPELVPGAVEENLRTIPSSRRGFCQPRRAIRDVQVGNLLVRKGQLALPGHDPANRDAAVFPDPDLYDPLRGRINHLSFSFGPHNCLGSHLARLESQIAFGELTRRIPDLELAVPVDELTWDADAMVLRPAPGPDGRALPVTWPRKAS
ncbi:cytochrome P450 [Actinomadura yumaensis]|uniref:Cytochrome P450 n=1 Tax=Actinomadura yumaensis TaxID=111807 RepID=A0ABW2CNM0_9ACTN